MNGNNCVISFTSGTNSWTVPTGISNVALFIVAGGGGGGYNSGGGGGGGGSGIVIISYTMLSQTLSFSSTAPSNAQIGGSYTVSGSSSAGLSVLFMIDSSTSSACSISGYVVINFLTTGTCTVGLNQAENAAYLQATQVQQSFNISLAASSISLTINSSSIQFQRSGVAVITAHLTGADGVVTFFINSKKIFHCVGINSSSLTAPCAWRPSVHGSALLSATFTPGGSSYTASISTSLPVMVTARSVARG